MNDMNQIEIKISNEEINYKEAVLFMESKVRDISENHSKELLWFLSHNHIFTQGTSASDDEILNSDVIEVLKTNRGGKTTYHGPGQRIVYFMLNLNNKKKDIRKFISVIENSVIDFLKNYNVEARAFKDRVGIWVIKNNKMTFDKEKKISAIGLRVKKWITYHGMSFNINPDLTYYDNINACGLTNYSSTSLERQVEMPGWEDSQYAIDKYKEQWVRSHYKNLGASMMNRRIDKFVEEGRFGVHTKDWADFLRIYARDSFGHPSTFSERIHQSMKEGNKDWWKETDTVAGLHEK